MLCNNIKQYDTETAEISREIADEAKILYDKSNLLREDKDVLKTVGYNIRIKGLYDQVISIHLTRFGLYVAIVLK